MPDNPKSRRRPTPFQKAVIEVASILFLFYANLLMGEFTASKGRGRSLAVALRDIVTVENFAIGLVSALLGYVVFEALRDRL